MVGGNVLRLPLPTLLPIGAVNSYVIPGDPTVMIDTGPNNEYTFEFLKNELRGSAIEISSIKKILITHGHVDHSGLARQISEASGAEVFVHKEDEDLVRSFDETFLAKKEKFRKEMSKCGIPERTLDLVEEFFNFLAKMADETEIAGHLEDGQEIAAGDGKLKVIHTPGHSAGSVSFLADDGVLFSGDTLPREYSPNVICGGSGTLSAGLDEYFASLEKLRAVETTEVYPGHGGPFTDKNLAIEGCLDIMRTREARIIRALQIDKATPFSLMTKVYGPLPIHELFTGLSEILGFLERMESRGTVEEKDEDGRRVFSLT